MAGSNYEVNIKLNLKSVNKQLNNLEKRISRINKLAQGGRASRTVNKNEQEKLKSATKRFQIETRTTREQKKQTLEKRKQFKIDQDNLKLINQKSTGGGRSTGGGVVGGGNKGKGGGVLSSALISGSFPLLFGQGLPGAIAGGLGGGLGAKFGGQMGGFAGGLVATALLQTFNNIKDGINQFGAELNDPSANLDKLIVRIKDFDRSIVTSAATLKNAGLDKVAGELADVTLKQKFGSENIKVLKDFNKELTKLGSRTKNIATRLSILIAGPLTLFFKLLNIGTDNLNNANKNLTSGQATEKTRTDFNKNLSDLRENEKKLNELELEFAAFKARKEELTQKKIAGTLNAQERIEFATIGTDPKNINLRSDLQKTKAIVSKNKEDLKNNEDLLRIKVLQEQALKGQLDIIKDQITLEQTRINIAVGNFDEKALAVEQKRLDIAKQKRKITIAQSNLESFKRTNPKDIAEIEVLDIKVKNLEKELELVNLIAEARIRAADPMLSRIDELNRELQKLNNIQRQTVELSKTIGSSFEDSFKGIIRGTMTVQDAFRNMLNKIADFFIDTAARMAANQLQKGLLGLFGNVLNVNTSKSIFDDQTKMSVLSDPFILPKAEGGPVKKGGRFLVGERGPELFTPGVSGMITPNHALGGSTTVVVNVDASGSSIEGDEQGGRELGRVISVAVQSEILNQKRPGGLLA